MERDRHGKHGRHLATLLRLLCLVAFILSSIGTHEAAWASWQHDGDSLHAGHHDAIGNSPHGHRSHGKLGSTCCLFGPCKLALPWRTEAPPAGVAASAPEAVCSPALTDANPIAPWRPPS